MKKYDIIFYKGNSLVGKFIKLISKSPNYSHCALVLDELHCLELAWNSKTKIKHFQYKNGEYDIYRLNFELTDKEIFRINKYLTKHLNQRYDYLYMITRGLNYIIKTPILNSKKFMNCDEIIVDAFRYAGINLVEDGKLSPELVSKSELLSKIN